MGQPTVTEQVPVVDSEPKADDIEIGKRGEYRTDEEEAPWDSGQITTCPDGKGSNGVSRRGRDESVVWSLSVSLPSNEPAGILSHRGFCFTITSMSSSSTLQALRTAWLDHRWA